ncbi:MAG: rhomboid family intramembrane serine protease, partial [Burkholderiales bacterium]|nr:rhomboid family intramembrane serine protease [Burkholderiales bacterium]
CASNLAQYQMTHSQFFGGMSGVLYGMFGYIWIRGRYDAHFSEDLQKNTIAMMLAWFVLCWTGLLGHIANWAHTAGLVAGIAWAYLDRLLPGKNPTQKHVLPDKQSLQYLSTADMLKLEQQRQWVRDHCASATRNQDDSVEATLRNIDQIVLLHHDKPLSKEDVHALDISFGDALAMATGASWATLEDRNGRTPVLYMPGATPVVFPVNSVALWLPHQSQKTIHQLFHEVAELMRSH